MKSDRSSFWHRRVWWVPAVGTALAVPLVAATVRPSEQGVLLTLAILCALPWTLALLLLDLSAGFAARAALVTGLGLAANVILLWWATALLRAHMLNRFGRRSDRLGA